MRSSSAITIWASSTSWWLSASSTRSSCSTIRSRAPSARVSSSFSCCWKCKRPEGCAEVAAPAGPSAGPTVPSPDPSALAELSGDIFLGSRVVRFGEDVLRRSDLDEPPVEHEGGPVGDASRLLHVVRDDHNRHALLELIDQL